MNFATVINVTDSLLFVTDNKTWTEDKMDFALL